MRRDTDSTLQDVLFVPQQASLGSRTSGEQLVIRGT
jgi:hypothetical protein